jgi:hypothetical protein
MTFPSLANYAQRTVSPASIDAKHVGALVQIVGEQRD